MNLREANTRFALLKSFADAIYAELATNRETHTARLVERYLDEGTKSFDVLLPDGVKVGSISLSIPKPTMAVTDQDALLAWCVENEPGALRKVKGEPAVVIPATQDHVELDPKAVTALLARAKPADDGMAVDPDTGTLIEGVTYRRGSDPKQFSVKYETDGRDALALAYRRGELNDIASGSALPQIEAP